MRWLLLALVLVACTQAPCDAPCTIDKAVAQGDPGLCEQLEMERTWCLNEVAAATGDEEVCRLMEEPSYCLRDRYVERGDSDACGTIPLDTARDDCYEELARNETDWSLCLPMEPGERREGCIERISRETNDYEGCTRLDDENERRAPCIYVTAIRANETAACELLGNTTLRNLCVAQITDNCSLLPPELQEACE